VRGCLLNEAAHFFVIDLHSSVAKVSWGPRVVL
jgi:hypothetical protein